MAQTVALVDTIKRCLKHKKITYADLAENLDLSEANVKRMFSKRNFTLSRLDEICQVLEMEISDLIREMAYGGTTLDELSIEEEAELVSDVRLLLMATLVVNSWEFEDIETTYRWDQNEIIQLMAKLDRMRIIDLLPGNKYRLLISRHFRWQTKGPVHQFFENQIQREFFNCAFEPDRGELLVFISGMLSRTSNKQLQRSIHRLAKEFDELSKEDSKLPLDERFGTSMVVAMRPWELGVFSALRKEPSDKEF